MRGEDDCHPGFGTSDVRSSVAHRYIPQHGSATLPYVGFSNTRFLLLEIRRQKRVFVEGFANNAGKYTCGGRARAVQFPGLDIGGGKEVLLGYHQLSAGPSAAQTPLLHLIPLLLSNLCGRPRTSLPYATGDASSTSQTDFWRIQTRAAWSPFYAIDHMDGASQATLCHTERG